VTTVVLRVTETLKYDREVKVKVPDVIKIDEFEHALEKVERSAETVDDFVHRLGSVGIQLVEPVDDDLSCPSCCEVECDDYEFSEG
jgi:hypothetical protein